MNWNQIRPAFEPDGALRDIYVLEATILDWQTVLDALRLWTPSPMFRLGGVEMAIPNRVSEIFAVSSTATALLSVFVEGVRVNCHFFEDDEIEFDLDPAEVTGEAQLNALAGFMGLLSRLTEKPVLLTDENNKTAPIFRILPGEAEPVEG